MTVKPCSDVLILTFISSDVVMFLERFGYMFQTQHFLVSFLDETKTMLASLYSSDLMNI